MIVDSHCHLNLLNLEPFNGSLDEVLRFSREQGVKHFLSIGTQLDETDALIAIAESYPDVDISVGEHPTEHPEIQIDADLLLKYAHHPKVIAIGETGLDYYRNEGDMTWQQDRFRAHIRVAKAVSKPIVVHTRMARQDTIRILTEEGASVVGGVMHCFTEDLAMARQAIDVGFYISFSGILTFKNAVELQEVAKVIPLERILVETDSPFLAPVPFRGKPNVPGYVRYTAAFLAELRGISYEEVAQQTTQNFYTLFKSAGH